MPEQTYNIESIKAENADGTQYSATVNGKTWSGISEHSRFWSDLQEAISGGATVAPFVPPPVPDPNLIEIQKIMQRQAFIIHDCFKQLFADGYLNVNGSEIEAQTKTDFANLQTYVNNIRTP